MASLSPVIFLTALVAVGHASERNEMHDAFVKAAEKCNDKIKASKSAVESFLKMEDLDDSKEGKCLIDCVFLALHLFEKGGKYIAEKHEEVIKTAFEEADQPKAQEVVNSCRTEVEKETDDCERSYHFMECLLEGFEKEHIKKPFEDSDESDD